jgi:hypothetical protein
MDNDNNNNMDDDDDAEESPVLELPLSSEEFNDFFYLPREEELIQTIQENIGCFNCNSPGAKSKCSACGVAIYCNRDWQRHHWKKAPIGGDNNNNNKLEPHNTICKAIQALVRKDKPELPFPVVLPLIDNKYEEDDDMVVQEMKLYSNLFIDEAARNNLDDMSLTVLCIKDQVVNEEGAIRLLSTARFISSDFTLHNVEAVIYEKVDNYNRNSIKNLYPQDGSFGSISEDAKEKSISHIINFIERIHDKVKGIRIRSMTCGRGLSWISNNDEVQTKLKNANGGADISFIAG